MSAAAPSPAAFVEALLADKSSTFAVGNEESWNAVLPSIEHVWTEYAWTRCEYNRINFEDKSEEYISLPLVLQHGGKAIGVFPLGVRKQDGQWSLVTGQYPVLAPLFSTSVSESVQRSALRECAALLHAIAQELHIEQLESITIVPPYCMSVWHRLLLEMGGHVSATRHYVYFQLDLGQEQMRSNVRRRFRSLISKGNKLWSQEVHTSMTPEQLEEFREFHLSVSGRSTRSDDTWNAQMEAVNKGEAFFVTSRNDQGAIVGEALYLVSSTEMSYAVGVYDRELFDQPVSHAIHMAAIEHGHQLGLRWYHVGERFYEADPSNPTDKEKSIAFFKEGFCSQLCLQLRVQVPTANLAA